MYREEKKRGREDESMRERTEKAGGLKMKMLKNVNYICPVKTTALLL